MKAMRMLNALNGIDSLLIEQAAPGKGKKPRWVRALAAVACLALVIGSAGTVIDRLGLFRAGCSAWPGDFIDGRYYYRAGHGTLYCWEDGQNTRVLGALQSDGKLVNSYGVYFTRGRRLYVKPHDTGKRQKLYTAPLFGCSHTGVGFYGEDVHVRLYDKRREWFRELLLDGVTGQVLAEVQPLSDYDLLYDNLAWGDTHLMVGERQIVLVHGGEEDTFDLTENGRSILPEGAVSASSYYHTQYDQVWFDVKLESGETEQFIVRPDGDDRLVTSEGNWWAAGDFAYCVKYDDRDEIWCLDTRTGESWRLETDAQMEFYEITSDGVHLASCVPWDDYQSMWRIEYDGQSRPVGLTLLDADISD